MTEYSIRLNEEVQILVELLGKTRLTVTGMHVMH